MSYDKDEDHGKLSDGVADRSEQAANVFSERIATAAAGKTDEQKRNNNNRLCNIKKQSQDNST